MHDGTPELLCELMSVGELQSGGLSEGEHILLSTSLPRCSILMFGIENF